MNNNLQLTDEEKLIIKNNFFPPNTTHAEMAFCMGVANQFGLNPILNQIYFVRRKLNVNGKWIEKTVPMVGRDGFLTIAHKSGKFAGIGATVELKKVPHFNGNEWVEEQDLIAICTIYRTDTERPFVVEVFFKEYVAKTKNGVPTKFWGEKGVTMLKKVAESQCLRKAFNISGIYAEEEINETYATYEVEENKKISIEDVSALLPDDAVANSNEHVEVEIEQVKQDDLEMDTKYEN